MLTTIYYSLTTNLIGQLADVIPAEAEIQYIYPHNYELENWRIGQSINYYNYFYFQAGKRKSVWYYYIKNIKYLIILTLQEKSIF